jgi:hypothetical protein
MFWAKIAGFAAGPWGALIGKFLMIMTVATMIYVAVGNYNESIRASERATIRNTQLEEVLKNQADTNKRLAELETVSNQILADTKKKNDRVEATHTTVNKYIASPEAQKSNRPSSNVIKKTVGMLKNDE